MTAPPMAIGNIVDLGLEDEATLEAVASVPAAALGSVRKKPTAEDVAAIVAKLKVKCTGLPRNLQVGPSI